MEQVAKTAPADGESASDRVFHTINWNFFTKSLYSNALSQGLDAHVETLDSSLTTLSQRVAAIVQYLKLVDEERAERGHAASVFEKDTTSRQGEDPELGVER